MLRMIKAEIYKLFKSNAFKVLCGVTLVLGILVIIGSTSMKTEEEFIDSLGDIPYEQKLMQVEAIRKESEESPVVIPGQLGYMPNGLKDPFNITPIEVFHTSFGIGVVEIIIVILVASMFAREYSSGTLKNTLAYGKKREHFYLSKFIATVVGTGIIVAILVIMPTVVTTFTKDWIGNFGLNQILEIIRTYFIAMVLYSAIIAILMLIVTIVRSKATTIGIGVLLFVFIPTFLAFGYGRSEWFDKFYELTIFYNTGLATAIKSTNEHLLQAVMVGISTLIICGLGGISIFKKQDIK